MQAEPARSNLRGWRIEQCDPGARTTYRPLHVVGRAIARDGGVHETGAAGSNCCRQVTTAIQSVDAPDFGRDRRQSLGSRALHPGARESPKWWVGPTETRKSWLPALACSGRYRRGARYLLMDETRRGHGRAR